MLFNVQPFLMYPLRWKLVQFSQSVILFISLSLPLPSLTGVLGTMEICKTVAQCARLVVFTVRTGGGTCAPAICQICHDDIGDCAAATTCGHVFHGDCLSTWEDVSEACGSPCPICRTPQEATTQEEKRGEEELNLTDVERVVLCDDDTPTSTFRFVQGTETGDIVAAIKQRAPLPVNVEVYHGCTRVGQCTVGASAGASAGVTVPPPPFLRRADRAAEAHPTTNDTYAAIDYMCSTARRGCDVAVLPLYDVIRGSRSTHEACNRVDAVEDALRPVRCKWVVSHAGLKRLGEDIAVFGDMLRDIADARTVSDGARDLCTGLVARDTDVVSWRIQQGTLPATMLLGEVLGLPPMEIPITRSHYCRLEFSDAVHVPVPIFHVDFLTELDRKAAAMHNIRLEIHDNYGMLCMAGPPPADEVVFEVAMLLGEDSVTGGDNSVAAQVSRLAGRLGGCELDRDACVRAATLCTQIALSQPRDMVGLSTTHATGKWIRDTCAQQLRPLVEKWVPCTSPTPRAPLCRAQSTII
jgi:hypothetical protein